MFSAYVLLSTVSLSAHNFDIIKIIFALFTIPVIRSGRTRQQSKIVTSVVRLMILCKIVTYFNKI